MIINHPTIKIDNNNLTISNVNLVDVIQGCINKNATFEINNGFIHKINYNRGKSSNKFCLYAIPGLIDSHVHLFEIHSGNKVGQIEYDYEIAKLSAIENIKEAIKVGVTCVRDVGAYSAFNNIIRNEIDTYNCEYNIRIFSCGNHISRDGGHWSNRGTIWNPNCTTLEEAVVKELKNGADFIKVMNDDPIFNLKELSLIANICKNSGSYLACHAFKQDTIDLAINAGARTIEHAACIDNEICEKAIKNDIYFCPTFTAAKDSLQHLSKTVKCVCDDCTQDELINWFNYLENGIPKMFQAGVNVIAGTDAGTFPTNFQSLPEEIIEFNKYGASSLQALQSATINPANAFNISHSIGSLEIGKSADIVLLKYNPLENLEKALTNIEFVISKGMILYQA